MAKTFEVHSVSDVAAAAVTSRLEVPALPSLPTIPAVIPHSRPAPIDIRKPPTPKTEKHEPYVTVYSTTPLIRKTPEAVKMFVCSACSRNRSEINMEHDADGNMLEHCLDCAVSIKIREDLDGMREGTYKFHKG